MDYVNKYIRPYVPSDKVSEKLTWVRARTKYTVFYWPRVKN
jgi:hypothetical protein